MANQGNGHPPQLPPWVAKALENNDVVKSSRDVAVEIITGTVYFRGKRSDLEIKDTVVAIRIPALLEVAAGIISGIVVPQIAAAIGDPAISVPKTGPQRVV